MNKRGDPSLKKPTKEEMEENKPLKLNYAVIGFLFFVVGGSMIVPIISKIGSGPAF